MDGVSKISLGKALTIVAGPNPPTCDGFLSTRLQCCTGGSTMTSAILAYIGSIDVRVEDDTIPVGSDEALVVGAGVLHTLVAVNHPARGLTIRGPAIHDKRTG